MKLYNRTITIALVLAALALILPATAQQPESTSKAGLTLKDLKRQNEEKKQGNGSSSGSSSSSNSGKSGGLNSLKKSNPSNGSGSGSYGSNGKSSKEQDPYVKKYGVTQEERNQILVGFFERFRMCRNHDGKFMPSSHDSQPFAVMYYPVKNFEYKAITGRDWTLGNKYDYTHLDTQKAKYIMEAITEETSGHVNLRLAGSQELNYGRTYGAVEVAAPVDGIYFDVDLRTFDIINQFVSAFSAGGGMG